MKYLILFLFSLLFSTELYYFNSNGLYKIESIIYKKKIKNNYFYYIITPIKRIDIICKRKIIFKDLKNTIDINKIYNCKTYKEKISFN